MEENKIDCTKCSHERLGYEEFCTSCSEYPRECNFQSRRKEVVVLGGSFNPITNAHMEMATSIFSARSKTCIDEVWFMPCYKHRYGKDMLDFNHRLIMLNLAYEKLCSETRTCMLSIYKDCLKVSSFERDNKVEGGTYVLLKALEDNYPNCNFSFAIGGDNANTIEKWANYEKLLKETKFFIFDRIKDRKFNSELEDSQCEIKWWLSEKHICVDKCIPPYSSTQVRELVESHRLNPYDEEISRKLFEMLPKGIYNYIMKNKLY